MSDTDERAQGEMTAAVLDEDERGELDRLRQEVAALRATAGARPRAPGSVGVGGCCRPLGPGVCGCPGLGARGVDAQPGRRFRSLRGDGEPGDPGSGVQSALTDRISSEVLAYIDVEQLANEAVDALAAQGLRPQLVDGFRDLTGPLAAGVAGLVHGRVGELVASPRVHLGVEPRHPGRPSAGEHRSVGTGCGDRDPGRHDGPSTRGVHRRRQAAARRVGIRRRREDPRGQSNDRPVPASTLVRAQTAYRGLDAVATWLPWITLMLRRPGSTLPGTAVVPCSGSGWASWRGCSCWPRR